MLLGHSAINFAANAFSAAFGLLNVVLFTRYFAPAEFGTYVLGLGFASVVNVLLGSWLRFPIMREQARGDGTDIRGYVVVGFFVSCVVAPGTYFAARLIGLEVHAAVTAVIFALSLSYFEITQELLRARLKAFSVMKATMVRAILVPVLGIALTTLGTSGTILLASSALAYLIAALFFYREVWSGVIVKIDRARLWRMAKSGLPLTLSMTLLAVSTIIDRFVVAYFAGPAQTGEYSAGVDLVRQALIIPAISMAAAFFPLSVHILANRGIEAVRGHLDECIEILMAITLPACLGIAITSAHIANTILGAEFRTVAAEVMPIVSIAVIFQILTCQYLHISFLLSERNSFYLLSTCATVAMNLIVACVLTAEFGAIGAAWSRLAAEMFGFLSALFLIRWAFPIPLWSRRLARVIGAAIGMAVIVKGLDMFVIARDSVALAILIPAGVVSYAALCWLLNVAAMRDRFRQGIAGLPDFAVLAQAKWMSMRRGKSVQ